MVKGRGTKGCCAPRLIPKVDHPEADRGGESNCSEDPASTPAGPVSPPGSVSLCVRMPLGAMCDQANENQGVSPASQAPLWDQQTECHSNRWLCLLSLCCPGYHCGLEDALFWEK